MAKKKTVHEDTQFIVRPRHIVGLLAGIATVIATIAGILYYFLARDFTSQIAVAYSKIETNIENFSDDLEEIDASIEALEFRAEEQKNWLTRLDTQLQSELSSSIPPASRAEFQVALDSNDRSLSFERQDGEWSGAFIQVSREFSEREQFRNLKFLSIEEQLQLFNNGIANVEYPFQATIFDPNSNEHAKNLAAFFNVNPSKWIFLRLADITNEGVLPEPLENYTLVVPVEFATNGYLDSLENIIASQPRQFWINYLTYLD